MGLCARLFCSDGDGLQGCWLWRERLPASGSPMSNAGHQHSAHSIESLACALACCLQIPTWFAIAGYVAMLAVAVGVVPTIYDQAKW